MQLQDNASLPDRQDDLAPGTSRRSWRDVLPVHPAADQYPLLGKAELAELGANIKARGLELDVILVLEGGKEFLVDGRSRLDALESNNITLIKDGKLDGTLGLGKGVRVRVVADVDPYALAASLNVHRRHLTPEQRRERIEALIRAHPEKSDRQIAEAEKASPTTVGKVRAKTESTVQVGQLPDKRVGKDGKMRPAKRKKPAAKRAKHTIVKGTASARPKNPPLTLDSLGWSKATPEERTKFVSAVGIANLVAAAPPQERAAYLAAAYMAEVAGRAS